MDEALNSSTQAAAPAAAPAPAVQPVAAQPAAPATPSYTVTPSASTESSSSGGTSVLDTLKNLNWVEIGIGILGVWGLFAVIGYYTNNRNILHPTLNDMQNKIDKITIELSDVKTALEKETLKQNTQSTQGFI